MTDTPQALPAGTRLGDGERYEIRQRIGLGGMAEVYRAVDTRLGNRIVAIKTLSASVAQHAFADRMRGLFIQEAQALSRVKDENVVDVLDFGVASDGTPFMVMEFLNGTDLGVFLRKNKQVSIEQAVDVMLGVCAGVHACHLAGIIHRDLKPANIFLTRTLKGEVTKVLDFSVAKVPLSRSTPPAEQLKTDLIVGTPTYMSPEQAMGRPANERSDQYSIGALLYRCLTGRPPQGVLPRPRDLRPEIPERLEIAMLRALEANPEKRFATVHELGHGLLPFASQSGRGRWRPYYRTPPLPIDPTTTGTIQVRPPLAAAAADAEPVSVPSAPATVAAKYDFKAHERTTSLDSDARRGEVPEAARRTKSTAVAAAEPLSVGSSMSSAPTSLDVHISEASIVAGNHSAAVDARPAAAPSRVSSVRTPRRFVAALAAVAALTLGITSFAVWSARRQHHPSTTPAAPAWTRTPEAPPPARSPAQPGAEAPAAMPPPPASPARPEPRVAEPVQEGSAGQAQAPSLRPKHRRQSRVKDDSIQYGADGLPILH